MGREFGIRLIFLEYTQARQGNEDNFDELCGLKGNAMLVSCSPLSHKRANASNIK